MSQAETSSNVMDGFVRGEAERNDLVGSKSTEASQIESSSQSQSESRGELSVITWQKQTGRSNRKVAVRQDVSKVNR
jgi:hypothetical protein